MQTTRYIAKGIEYKVCKLLRSIYELKQASHSWNQRFDQAIKTFGFEQNVDEHCAYKHLGDAKVVFLFLYIDDILLIRNDVGTMSLVKLWLTQRFNMKDLGEANFFPEIQILRDRKNKVIALSRASYIGKILECYSMTDSKKGNQPSVSGFYLSLNDYPKITGERENMRKPIEWKSVKQTCTTDPTMEVKYVAGFQNTKEAIWFSKL
ncbi:gag/pol protein [Gossypium australe]|uniref:Gag/pol protein n=1 Tax=Gossypium australe TaxID=47621 RepID=A0A5B6V4V1_9ROSI|nr:gag/pol protein [Gossypium australe]